MVKVTVPKEGFLPERAAGAVQDSGLVAHFSSHAVGDFGPLDARASHILELLRDAVDVSLATHHALTGLLHEQLAGGPSFRQVTLGESHRQAAFFFFTSLHTALEKKEDLLKTFSES